MGYVPPPPFPVRRDGESDESWKLRLKENAEWWDMDDRMQTAKGILLVVCVVGFLLVFGGIAVQMLLVGQ
jgi:hypothetical protein